VNAPVHSCPLNFDILSFSWLKIAPLRDAHVRTISCGHIVQVHERQVRQLADFASGKQIDTGVRDHDPGLCICYTLVA
jgi:hypothetical protein